MRPVEGVRMSVVPFGSAKILPFYETVVLYL